MTTISTSARHFERLDHIRAIAAICVLAWHAIHVNAMVPFDTVPAVFLLSVLEEGHVGVAIFMVLSGYLFTRLVDGAEINRGAFYFNRALRILPLLMIVLCIEYWVLYDPAKYGLGAILYDAVFGIAMPLWPGTAWSVAVELQFYLILPLILPLVFLNPKVLLFGLLFLFAARLGYYSAELDVKPGAYFTLLGRGDQFLMGMFFARISKGWRSQRGFLALTLLGFVLVWHGLNMAGGYHVHDKSIYWVVVPTIEAVGLGLIIALYDRSGIVLPRLISEPLIFIATISFSLYMWHKLVLVEATGHLLAYGLGFNTLAGGLLFSAALLAVMIPISYVSYKLFEQPFLKWRRPYIIREKAASDAVDETLPRTGGDETIGSIPMSGRQSI